MRQAISAILLLFIASMGSAVWIPVDVGVTEHLLGMCILDPGNVYFCGNAGTIIHFDGSQATPMESNIETDIQDIAMLNTEEGWAVGDEGVILHYTGGVWTPIEGINKLSFQDLHIFDADNVVFIGYTVIDGSSVLQWDGTAITEIYHSGVNFLDMAATGPDDIWIVGGESYILHFDGTEWTEEVNTLPERTKMFAVAINEDGNPVVDGMRLPQWDKALIYTKENGSWITQYENYEPWIKDLDFYETIGFAVGKDGRMLAQSIFGWERTTTVTNSHINEINLLDFGTGYAVCDSGNVLKYQATAIDMRITPNEVYGSDLLDVSAMLINSTDQAASVDVFILLEAYGYFYFWPSWTEDVGFDTTEIPANSQQPIDIFTFEWPTGTGAGQATFWAALLEGADLIAYDTELLMWH